MLVQTIIFKKMSEKNGKNTLLGSQTNLEDMVRTWLTTRKYCNRDSRRPPWWLAILGHPKNIPSKYTSTSLFNVNDKVNLSMLVNTLNSQYQAQKLDRILFFIS